MLSVRNSLKDELLFDNVYYWCDSQIALVWIKSLNKEFRTFIENRVIEMRKNSLIENWHYCKTKENPLRFNESIYRFKQQQPLLGGANVIKRARYIYLKIKMLLK